MWFLRLLLVALLLVNVSHIASADVIELKTGERVEGASAQAGVKQVTIKVGGQTVSFEREKVRAIYLGAPPAPATSTGATNSTVQDAIKALRGLQSATTGGIAYREYASRVTDAKIAVDEYLREPEGDNVELRRTIASVMAYHVVASSGWNTIVSYRDDATRRSIARALSQQFPECPDFQKFIRGIEVGFAGVVSIVWSCASVKLAEAEKLLGQ